MDKHKCKGSQAERERSARLAAPTLSASLGVPRRRLSGKQRPHITPRKRLHGKQKPKGKAVISSGAPMFGRHVPAGTVKKLMYDKTASGKSKDQRKVFKKRLPPYDRFPLPPIVTIPGRLTGNLCPYCKMPRHGKHVQQCNRTPWPVWVQGRRKELKQPTPSGFEHWSYHCPYCKIACNDTQHFSRHIGYCQKRRVASGLPLF